MLIFLILGLLSNGIEARFGESRDRSRPGSDE
jgi:hypothetical protein